MATLTEQMTQPVAQLGIPVPLCYGLMRATGNKIIELEYTDSTYGDKTRLVAYCLAEGEWNALKYLWVNRKRWDVADAKIHFHPGLDGQSGSGSVGGDQKADAFYSLLTGIEPLTFSRKACLFLKVPPDPGAPSADLEVWGDYESTKVRIFDATGAQTAYQYTTNPAWCTLDAILRAHIKRNSLLNSPLSAAEKARFDFPSFVDTQDFCDYDIGGGIKRCEVSLAWPQQTNLTNVLEQLLLCSRSYLLEVGGVIYMRPDKPRAYSFLLTADHLVPGQGVIVPEKKTLRGAANHFLAHYRDTIGGQGEIWDTAHVGLHRVSGVVTCVIKKAHGCQVGDPVFVVQADDPSFDGGPFAVTDATGSSQLKWNQAGPDATSGGGLLCRPEWRFTEGNCTLDHQAHQLAVGQRGLGLAVIPKKVNLELDFGDNTAERVARLTNFRRLRDLGDDALPYKAPWEFRLKCWMEAVDANQNILMAQLPGDVIRIDSSVSEEMAGDYEMLEANYSFSRDEEGKGGDEIDLWLKEYMPNAFTDAAPDVQPLLPPNSGPGLITTRGPANYTYRLIGDTPLAATDAGTTATINAAGFAFRVAGISPDPTYNSGALVGLQFDTHYWVIVEDPDLLGGAASIDAVLTKDEAIGRVGWLIVDGITTPKDGGTDTKGDGLGGGSVQSDQVTVVYPGQYVADTWTNPERGIDQDPNSYAELTTAGGGAVYDALGFPALTQQGFSALVLKIKHQLVALTTALVAYVKYSKDDGVTWTVARTISGADGAPVTTEVHLALSQDLTKVRARLELPAPPGSGGGGPSDATVVANDTSIAGAGWTLGTPATLSCTADEGIKSSCALKCTGLGFAVPAGSTILGVKVDVTRIGQLVQGQGSVTDRAIRLVKAGTIQTPDKSSGTPWAFATYGGASDLWGGSWTDADINSSGFGFAVAANLEAGANYGASARVSKVTITVYYQVAGGPTTGRVYQITQEAQY